MSSLLIRPLWGSVFNRDVVKPKAEDFHFHIESRYIKMVKFGLRGNGLWKSSTVRTLNIPLVITIQCLLFSALLGTSHQLLFVAQNLNTVTELMMHVLFIVHTIITHLSLVWKQPTILKMFDLIESRFDDFSGNIFRENTLQEIAEKKNAAGLTAITVIISSVHLSFIATSKVYMVNLPPEQKSLLYPVTVPFEMSDTVYYVVYSLQLITTFFEGVTHITSIAICTGFMNILCAEFLVLGQAFRQMGYLGRQRALQCSGTEVGPSWNSGKHLDYHAQALLRSFVQHHILILNFYKDLQTTFTIPILEMFLNGQIMLCSCGFHLFKLYQQSALEQVFKQFCMFFALLSHEFVYFWSGSHLTLKVERFRNDVNACDWIERSPHFKRSYRIVLERIKRGVTIQASFLPVNLATFAKCLQAAFSYFNLLLALSYKQEKMR